MITRFIGGPAFMAALVLQTSATLLSAAEDFAGQNLSGRDFSGQRLLDANFARAKLAGAKFRGAILRGAVFDEADVTGADFRQSDLRGASFKNARGLETDPGALRNALYSAATVWPAGFAVQNSGASLIEGAPATTTKTESKSKPEPAAAGSQAAQDPAPSRIASPALDSRPKSGVDMKGEDLSNKSFVGKYLNGGNFDATKINFTTFNNAELQGATFRAAEILVGYFKGADLTGADFTGAKIERANFAGAKLNGAKLQGARLMLNGWNGHLEPPKLNPDLKYSYELKEAMATSGSDWMHNHNLSLKGADLRGARIAGDLETVDLRKSDLRGADLSEVTNAEDRFLKDAIYDSSTVWWRGFDPVKAGAKKEEGASPLSAAAAPGKVSGGKGIAGFFWRVSTSGVEGTRLLYIYPDGKYSWALGGGEYLDKTWSSQGGSANAIVLENGPGGENWTAGLEGETSLSLRSASGKTLRAERGEPTKE